MKDTDQVEIQTEIGSNETALRFLQIKKYLVVFEKQNKNSM
jgi:hypothetical protein